MTPLWFWQIDYADEYPALFGWQEPLRWFWEGDVPLVTNWLLRY